MAIGTPTAIGQNNTSTAASSLVITITAPVPAGAMIVLEIANHNNVVPSSVTDSAGNTYTLVSASNGTTVTETLAYALNAAALASGASITITWASARNAAAAAYAVTGIATAAAADQQASNTTGSSATPSVGPTSATTQADELVIGLFGYSNSRTFTPGSGYTALATVESTGTVRGTCGEYKIVSATGAQTADGTLNSSATYAGVIVTFKAAAASGVALSASGTIAISGAAVLSASFPATAGTVALTGAAALTVTGGTAALTASGTIAISGAAALVFRMAASGTIALSGVAVLSSPALSASGALAITGAALLSASFPLTSGAIALSGAAALTVTGGLTALAASGTIRITGALATSVSGGPVALAASGTIRITGSTGITPVTAGMWFSVIAGGGQWHWTRFRRPLIDRYLNITIAASGGTGYLGVTADGTNYTWYAGPLGADGRTLTQVADETAAKAAAIALPISGVWSLPTTTEARVFKLCHKASAGGYQLYEFYPRRVVEADDIRAESIKAIHIAAHAITADQIATLNLDATARVTAGGGAITLDNNGLRMRVATTITVGSYYSGDRSLDFVTAAGARRGSVFTWESGGAPTIEINAVPASGQRGYINLAANDDAGVHTSGIAIGAGGGNSGNGRVYIRSDEIWLWNGLSGSTDVQISGKVTVSGSISLGSQSGVAGPAGQLRLGMDSGNGLTTTRPNQIALFGSTNANIKAEIGIDTALKILVIGMVEEGTAYRDIVLANNGGNVGIGSANPTEKLAVAGNVNVSGVYKVGGTQVLGGRKTGWSTPTGTLNRAALTNASTQAQFNQALMALITDLVSHGAIGA